MKTALGILNPSLVTKSYFLHNLRFSIDCSHQLWLVVLRALIMLHGIIITYNWWGQEVWYLLCRPTLSGSSLWLVWRSLRFPDLRSVRSSVKWEISSQVYSQSCLQDNSCCASWTWTTQENSHPVWTLLKFIIVIRVLMSQYVTICHDVTPVAMSMSLRDG